MNIPTFPRHIVGVIISACGLLFLFLPETPAVDKCEVCHNSNNPHSVIIPCKQVDKYLADHPGDYAGACQGMSDEKPLHR